MKNYTLYTQTHIMVYICILSSNCLRIAKFLFWSILYVHLILMQYHLNHLFNDHNIY
jgi:hypothetical protein